MPFSRVSAYGVSNGNVTDAERMSQQQRQADMQAQAAMAELAARERMHGKSDSTQRYGVDAGLKQSGTFQDRAGHEAGMFGMKAGHETSMGRMDTERQLGVTGLQMAPANSAAALNDRKYEDGAGVDRAVNAQVLKFIDGMNAPAGQAPTGGAPAPGGMSEGELQRFGVLAALRGGGAMPDFQAQAAQRQVQTMQLDEMKRAQAKGRAQELLAAGDPTAARAAATTAGVPLEMPRIEEYMAGDGAGFASELSEKTKGFAARDTSVTGWDPSQGDVDGIMGELSRLVGVLEKRGYPREDAVREASRIIKNSMGEDQNDVNAGMIGNLRGRVDGFR